MWNSEFIVTTGRLALSAAATTSVAWIASPVHSSTMSEFSISSASELVSSSGRGKPVHPSTPPPVQHTGSREPFLPVQRHNEVRGNETGADDSDPNSRTFLHC